MAAAMLAVPGITEAGASFLYKEANIITGYSTRDDYVGTADTLTNSVGFEHFMKFSSEYGDYLTTDIQARFTYDVKDALHDAWAFEIHNAWLEYKLYQAHKLKFGHFDPAFGLEPVTDTHGTMLQTLLPRNLGFKKDWGLALKGGFEKFDYKAALQLGSGMSVRKKDGSYLVTARVGSVPENNFQYGASFMVGDILRSRGMSTLPRNHLLTEEAFYKIRGGLDCQYDWNEFVVKSEFAYGADEDDNVLGYLVQLDYTPPRYQNWQANAQFQSWINDLGDSGSDDSTLGLTLSYNPIQKLTLRAALFQDINRVKRKEETKLLAQVYYYGL